MGDDVRVVTRINIFLLTDPRMGEVQERILLPNCGRIASAKGKRERQTRSPLYFL